MDLMLDLQEALNTTNFYNLDGDLYGNSPDELFSNDPLTVGGVADPIVKVKLKNGKILLAGQYEMQIFSSVLRPGHPRQPAGKRRRGTTRLRHGRPRR